jgi:hypothetical protein
VYLKEKERKDRLEMLFKQARESAPLPERKRKQDVETIYSHLMKRIHFLRPIDLNMSDIFRRKRDVEKVLLVSVRHLVRLVVGLLDSLALNASPALLQFTVGRAP